MGKYNTPVKGSGTMFSDCSQTGGVRPTCNGGTVEKPVCCAAATLKPTKKTGDKALDDDDYDDIWDLVKANNFEICHESKQKELAKPIFV